MQTITEKNIAEWFNIAIPTEIHFTIQHIAYDTRLINPEDAPQTLFVALKTPHNDGQKYIDDAIQKGVTTILRPLPTNSRNEQGVSIEVKSKYAIRENENSEPQPIVFINYLHQSEKLPDTPSKNRVGEDLQALAKAYRTQFDALKTIAITGSNGKTIVKEWLAQALALDEQVVRSPKSFNSQIGVPISIFQIEMQHTVGIFEAGISEMGEMKDLQQVIQPQIGIFTNILAAHDSGFPSKEAKAAEKALLFVDCAAVIYNYDDIYCRNALKNSTSYCFAWSRIEKTANLYILEEARNGVFTKITAIYKGEEKYIEIPFLDAASIENAIHVWATLLYLGYSQTIIRERLCSLEALEARLELKNAVNNSILINDSYSLDLDSLRIALEFMQEQDIYNKKTVILSQKYPLKNEQEKNTWIKAVAQLLNRKKVNKLVAVGEGMTQIRPLLLPQTAFFAFDTTDILLKQIDKLHLHGETILLKGARHFEFERVAELLAQRAHKTVLEINLEAIKHNFKQYKNLVGDTKLMVMVKAHAYGSGAYQVARLLEHQKVDMLAVAYTDEGYELRQNGITTPIMVMNVEENAFDALIRHHLSPEIYSLTTLRGFAAATRRFHALHDSPLQTYPIHLKLDTGMKRLGFERNDLTELCQLLLENKHLVVATIFTHLVATDNPEHDDFTAQQINLFSELYAQITAKIGYTPLRHILNTSGISRFHQRFPMEMVRLGIGLYGVDAEPTIQKNLQTVLTLKATISQIKTVQAGETIGYNRMGKATRNTRIATVSIGYADGISRSLSNGKGAFLVENQLAFIIGNVCMDMCMIDITDIPSAKEGAEVVIFGESRPVQDFATQAQTIPYEIFTNVSNRVKRVYFSTS